MKRALFEWGAIVTSTLAVLCVAYWVASVSGSAADFTLPVGGMSTVEMSASDGMIDVCDDPSFIIEPNAPCLKPDTGREWTLPGIRFRRYTFVDHRPVWRFNLSLLIPAVLMMFVAFVFLRRYRKIRATLVQSVPSLGGPVQHPLD